MNLIRLKNKLAVDEARAEDRQYTPLFWTGHWEKPVLIKMFTGGKVQ